MGTRVKTLHKRITPQYVTAFLFLFLYANGFAQLYSNGNLSTGVLSKSGLIAPAGYSWSELQNDNGNTTECNKSSGFAGYFNTAGTSSFELADDFVVPAGQQWNITSFDFFAHQNSFTGTTIPVDQLRIEVWNGDPSLPASEVVIGDMTTNVLDAPNSTGNTFIYRIANSIIGNPIFAPNTNRKVWKIKGNINTILNSGTYWVVYQFHAINDGAIFIPTVTIEGTRGVAGWNAKQNFVANTIPGTVLGWANVIDIGDPDTAADVPQDLPFSINGTIVNLSTLENDFSASVLVYPNPTKNTLNISNQNNTAWNSITIFDQSGRKLKSITAAETSIDVSEFASGNYILKIKFDDATIVKRFIKM
ncbi:T9SS type A sorting domain-containing protein [Flavobacterium wongokense]|uniref:T9SS type A sorting domain-containing protein n=1 Tax=Flavobacterium wongokense TaxID=2910674 RepID=UPI001F48D7F7|nr:T9SS type A sorting domain-containing protein [Flavobacterium sp. WG47]MCF6130963.1 T9SS type A sorting domain-containing protein [Flavobacterium sp. WG47]